ncbi:MAG: hypothetical protein KAQ98_02550 [Bacteriovoracaceae bacterium]|nr:hypothetical protein [Bacteriovoracaceae bacterium]
MRKKQSLNDKKRYVSIKEHKGLRKDLISGKIYVRKTINKKQYSAYFDSIREAIHWRNTFHPSLNYTKYESTRMDKFSDLKPETIQASLNGEKTQYRFSDIWEYYQEYYFPTLSRSTVEEKGRKAQRFFDGLMNFKMVELSAELLDLYLKEKVKIAKVVGNPRRFDFNSELKILGAFLNWYRNNYDPRFINPILPRHKIIGMIKKKNKSKKKMTKDQVLLFFDSFEDQFWRDFAEFQFYATARVQEVGGLQKSNVNLSKSSVEIINVAVWIKRHTFTYLKEIPKNGEPRCVHINNRLREILERRLSDVSKIPCKHFFESTGERLDFVFHINGEPPSYRVIQYQYNRALKRAGLFKEFRSTHIMRKAMANIVT